ncbi:MAG: pyridoxal phosphate-dependent aminotransferase, partial [Nevskiales bacterium]
HDIDATSIVLGNGSNDVLELIARCFLGPGRNAVFSEYAFAVYPLASLATGADLRIAPALAKDSDMPYGHDLNALLAQVNAETGVVFIANPNNPTGTWLDPEAIANFLKAVPSQVVVVLDEAYFEYMQVALRPDSRSLLEQHENLVVTRTFSKVHGLAGLRMGYGLASPVIADLLNRVRQPFNANSAAMAAAIAALDDTDHVARSVAANQAGLQQVLSGLQALGLRTLPTQANFLTFELGSNAAAINDALLRAGVILRPLASYAMPDYLRVTIGTEQENQRFLQVLSQLLEQAA